jgi:hypothetical protein
MLLMMCNLHITVNLLLAMKQHQHFEYKLHKRPIITQLVVTTATLAVLVYGTIYSLMGYGCRVGERKFGLSNNQDS